MLKKGFTLAEVLMTLAIIGVVAAMTLPTLNYNIGRQTLEKQTTKFYSQLHDGIMLRIAETGSYRMKDKDLRKLFNIVTVCGKNQRKACLGDDLTGSNAVYLGIDDSESGGSVEKEVKYFFPEDQPIYMLADGGIFTVTGNNIYTFDVNGASGPNTYGYDLWRVKVFEDGSIDDITMTMKMRQEEEPAVIATQLQTNFDNCKSLTDITLTVDEESGEISGGSGSCFGHFMRNRFKFDY